MREELTFVAGAAEAGERLDRFLALQAPEISRARLKVLIEAGEVRLNARTIEEPSYRVKPGDRFSLSVPEPVAAIPLAESLPLDIVYEDDALIVVDKPAGLVVHPAPGHGGGTLVNALLAHCGDSLSGIGGVKRPGIVHRLDKDTSGLLVVAKTDAAHQGLAAQFADHGRTGALDRRYLALVWGAPRERQGTISAPLGRHPTQRLKMGVRPKDGREAITHYRVEEVYRPASAETATAAMVECALETGRTHQVRVHLAHLGCPVIGDPLYASGFKTKSLSLDEKARAAVFDLGRQALHAASLAFDHPISGQLLEFKSPLPSDMAEIVLTLSNPMTDL